LHGLGGNSLTTRYWKEALEENEKMRFSQLSKGAFEFLKRVFKCNQYEKQDGSIVNKVRRKKSTNS